ncbi:hypothetical protein [uncultured Eubacterium sp.]|uniref:putative ABC transporter permease n=1 Tax=uncultured Eubacterium sp. TaxID=165185 RepID=UPI002676E215|nr:hypothetical protein [uncultured Eubacterium sp.]
MIFSVYEIILLFFIYSFLGWCVEVAFVAVTTGKVVDRGFLNGPVCPIYGCGMVGVLIILLPVKNNVWLLFLGGMIICSTVELFGGWILDKIFRMRWWDYSEKPFNIGGYICLPFSIMWGFAVVFAVKFVHTPIMFLVKKVPGMGKLVLIIFFVIIFTVDMIVTLKNLIGIKKSLGQLDLIAEELNNIGNQIKDVVGNSAIDMADKAEQAKDELGKSSNEYIEKLKEKKDELGKSGNGYIEKLKARKAELEKSSSGYINNINKYRKHIFNTLPTLNKSGKSIKILEYIKDIIESKEDKKEDKSDS